MFLKEIEMQGFKSFADKTKVEFDQGVTAVVGPNGSGKSNITESLRWALGESSAKSLRGGKMPDVIFAGTENRKPLNYAQVSVTLDNSDHFIENIADEVRVERRIFRNGDSEYLIDGRKVRLRDIHDLFMDTGLGRDSFSIISQGRVEAIFNSKPEERRAIFEEAAGVLKYKTRKKETQSKLEQTQGNLDRLEDIIYELDMQVQPLEKQASIAKRFLVLDEERQGLHLSILIEDILQNQSDLTTVEEKLLTVREELATYYQQRQSLEDENQSLKQKRHHLSEEIEAKQLALLDVTKLKSDLERQIDLIRLESSQKAEKKEEAGQRLAELEIKAKDCNDQITQKNIELTTLSEKIAQIRSEIVSIESSLERFSTNPDQVIEKLREDFVTLMQEEADTSNALTALLADIENQKQASQAKSQEIQEVSKNLEVLKSNAKVALERFEAAKKNVRQLLSHYQDLGQTLQNLEGEYKNQQSILFDHLDEIKSKQARISSLESILKNHSNFYAGVKSVLQAKDQIGGIIGAVSEHLSFDKHYQTALEIALGGSSQHIIVEDESAAKRSIAFLKKNRQGRATFLPLTTIKPRELAQHYLSKLQSSQGFLGIASELVTYDQRLSNIFKNNLGLTAIFDTVDNANVAARQLNYQVRLVTLDGTELRPGGSYSGGANRQNNTVFIKPELDNLKKELKQAQSKQLIQEKEVAALLEQLKEKQETLTQLKNDGEQARLEEQRADIEYQQLSEKLADLNKLYNGLQLSSGALEQTTSENEKNRLEKELEQFAIKKEELTTSIAQIKEDKDSIQEKVNNLTTLLSEAQLEERDLLNEQKFERANCTRLEITLSEIKRDISNLQTLLSHQDSQLDKEELPRIEKQLLQANKRRENDEEKLVSLRFELEDCEAALDDLAASLAKEGQKNESLIRQQAQLESQCEQLSQQLMIFSRQLSEDYQMTLDEAKVKANVLEDILMAREQLKSLQAKIKALGPVNIDAIAQFEEVHERLTFLNTQRDDLVHAKNLLLETITDMDDEVKTRFKSTFEAIRHSFKETFVQMFGGGSADLILTEGDLLSAGVDISVQPPGKKIQSLNLMSGGEKALSALALLFAIIRVKTIPFVILDEVEAALDEANVKRFGDYLNRFDKSSQFIVVTHRKGTMSAADSIYGVTMQESGVSKIVSVKLKEAQEMTN
ncbi:chromosome segregation protein SMC [Streptococcus agalactiae]|uniref:chromosome segregation protein SMC n=1 Tax=Streptococcus agalactiae TaxID=1311 RepID=UPI0002EC657A|nr:chromosome segregation protein SMC [Streptococcus agalactiae]